MPTRTGKFEGLQATDAIRVIEDHMSKVPIPGEMEARVLHVQDQMCASAVRDRVFRTISEVFDICDTIDNDSSIAVPRAMLAMSAEIRRDLLFALLREFYAKRRTAEIRSLDTRADRVLDREQRLAVAVAQMIPIIHQKNPETFDQHWLKLECTDIVATIERELVSNPTRSEDWEAIRRMMPASLQGRFIIDPHVTENTDTVKAMNAYRDLARQLGAEAVAQLMISNGLFNGKFETAMRAISRYLGRCASMNPGPGDVAKYPPAVLKLQGVRELITIKLRNYFYDKLHEREEELLQGDGASESFERN